MQRSTWHGPLVIALAAAATLGCSRDSKENVQPDPATTAGANAPLLGPRAELAAEGWNDTQIDWQPYEAGLAAAKAKNKPVCLVFYTGWCPHCKNYSRVFDDAKVVEKAKSFVMVHLNADEHSDIAKRYTPDGGYIPRTFFLQPDGTLLADIHAPRPKFKYFYDENNPAGLLGGMAAALARVGK